jgi:hypothetical protein
MLCVILRTSACAIRASSCVNLSSFLRASSRSANPANFLRNFSACDLVKVHTQLTGNSLADPRFNSFVAIPKILSTSAIISVNYVCHCRSRSHLCICIESRKKPSDAVEKLRENVFARCNSLGRLYDLRCEDDLSKTIDGIPLAESKTPMPVNITFAGENTCRTYIRGLH